MDGQKIPYHHVPYDTWLEAHRANAETGDPFSQGVVDTAIRLRLEELRREGLERAQGRDGK